MRMNNKIIKICLGTLIAIFLATMIIFTIYPIVYAVIGSFKTNSELTAGGSFLPKSGWQVMNYWEAFIKANFTKYTMNSIIISFSTMVIAVLTSSLAGYVFARQNFVGKKLIMLFYVALMFIALGSVTLYPIYSLLMKFGLHKNIIGLILVLTGGQSANVLLVMGFIQSIPKELDEAAIIDGCSMYGIFFRILRPLITPIMAVVALFTFRNAWNDYVTTLVMSISMPKLKTLTVAVVQLKYSMNAAAEWHIMLAGASIAIIPILIVYFFANKQFISGLTAGAVKG